MNELQSSCIFVMLLAIYLQLQQNSDSNTFAAIAIILFGVSVIMRIKRENEH